MKAARLLALLLLLAPCRALADEAPLMRQGIAAYEQGKLDSALEIFERLLEQEDSAGRARGASAAATCLRIAAIHDERRAYRDAEEYYRRALGIRREVYGETHPLVADVMNDLAILDYNMTDYAVAADLHAKALAIRRSAFGETNPLVATSLSNLGAVHRSRGDFPRAIAFHERALAIRRALYGDTHPDVAASWNNLGTASADMLALDSALAFHRRALAIRRAVRGDTHPDVAASWNNLGYVLRELDRVAEARECLALALAIWRATVGESHPFIASAALNLGDVLRMEHDSEDALRCYDDALRIARASLGRHRLAATACERIGLARLDRGETAAAVAAFEEGLNAMEDPNARTRTWRAQPLTVSLLDDLSRAEADDTRAKNLRRALAHAEAALDALEAMRADLSASGRAFQEFRWRDLPGRALRLRKRLEELGEPVDHAAVMRAMELASAWSFLELLAEARADLSSALPESWAAEERELEAEGRRLEASSGDPLADIQRSLWQEREDSFVRRVRAAMPRYAAFRYPSPVALADVRAMLRPDEVALQFLPAPESSYLLALSRDTTAFIAVAGESELAAALLAAREKISGRRSEEPELARLSRDLLHDVEPMLRGKNLVIAPQGALDRLAFEMLPLSGGGRLGESRVVSYAPSLSILALLRTIAATESRPGDRLFAIGDPLYRSSNGGRDAAADLSAKRFSTALDGTWTPLPATRVEVKIIAGYFPRDSAQVYFDRDATEDRFAAASSSWDGGYQHFACHGALEDGPGREPALVLSLVGNPDPSDGFLTLSEIVRRPRRARLTVLSACQSGVSSSRLPRTGVSSLARAFLMSGSDAVVVSLWSVDDEATARLMAEFYRLMRVEKLAPAAALARARASLAANPLYANPAYWAPFVLVGG